MSCIRFNTPAQQRQLDELKNNPERRAEAIAQWLSPELTTSKVDRIRALAKDKNPKIRESAALSYHLPEDVARLLLTDKNEGVRICLARNEYTPCDILRELSKDKSAQVRSWVAINYFVPEDVMHELSEDPSPEVRKLVAWKSELASSTQ